MIPDLEEIPGVAVTRGARLAPYSTFRLGGPCKGLIDCETPLGLRAAVGQLGQAGERYVLLGGGSNVLISDHGYDGYVVRFAGGEPDWVVFEGELTVSANATLDDLARVSSAHGLAGLTCCSGIPGTVGGAVVGNAGAWGQQIGDRLTEVVLVDRYGSVRIVPATDLDFDYRRSRLQREFGIVLSARFRLEKGDAVALLAERDGYLAQRASKHPDLEADPCIGSFFRNLEPTSAAERRQASGWFLEQVGAKEMREGGAEVFEKHANIIVARPGCTAQNVRDLSVRMAEAVKQEFGLELVREIRFLGRFQGEEEAEGYY